MDDAYKIDKHVQIAMRRAEHNALAGVEDMCIGNAAKLKRYAPLLRRIAKWKAGLRVEMQALQSQINRREEGARNDNKFIPWGPNE